MNYYDNQFEAYLKKLIKVALVEILYEERDYAGEEANSPELIEALCEVLKLPFPEEEV